MASKINALLLRAGEVGCYVAGVILTGLFAVQLAQSEVQRQVGLSAFEPLAAEASSTALTAAGKPDANGTAPAASLPDTPFGDSLSPPDTQLWSAARIADYERSLDSELPPVLGVLEIPGIELAVPVYATDSGGSMDRGAGIIDGMSYPHEPGNIGIAGHRDGYFRALKDVKPGDRLLLKTLAGAKRFVVSETRIVEIDDLALLQDTQQQTVTLVTCYPFYFVGNAPQRFIVTASLESGVQSG
tara:strand:- start:64822 stop:65550 length:729 start_codon:yes stop_codon:yes gene_type:complete